MWRPSTWRGKSWSLGISTSTSTTTGVETLDYLPWAVLCYTGFIFAIIWGYTGFGIAKLSDAEKAAAAK